jgi:RNA polymerase sigma-70 factor, ECF subfamily
MALSTQRDQPDRKTVRIQETAMQTAIYPVLNSNNASATGRNWLPASTERQGAFRSVTDGDLVTRCHASDNKAFEALTARYSRYIYSVAYKLAGNHDDASDLVSETFIRIFRHVDAIQRAATLPAWIKRIVTNAYLDTRRTARRKPVVSLDAIIEQTGDVLMAVDDRPDDSPQRIAERHERSRILNAAVHSLSTSQQEMITLFHTGENSYEEIAIRLRIPVGTVKSRLNRARAALREKLLPQMSILTS